MQTTTTDFTLYSYNRISRLSLFQHQNSLNYCNVSLWRNYLIKLTHYDETKRRANVVNANQPIYEYMF